MVTCRDGDGHGAGLDSKLYGRDPINQGTGVAFSLRGDNLTSLVPGVILDSLCGFLGRGGSEGPAIASASLALNCAHFACKPLYNENVNLMGKRIRPKSKSCDRI